MVASQSFVFPAGNGGFGARGRGGDGGQRGGVGRQQFQPLQHPEELPAHLQSALLLQGTSRVHTVAPCWVLVDVHEQLLESKLLKPSLFGNVVILDYLLPD